MNSSRRRKITYLLLIVGLFTALIGISQWVIEPAADKHQLAQKSLGNINPVSGTAQLVFLGFRGVAVTFLWSKANDLKRDERFFEIRPVVESITLLQPNFIKPWSFQAWNMAYNIAADWESVKDKYYWIREGIDFLKNASKTNRNVCEFRHEVGSFYFGRFGSTDEKTFLREMFRQDLDDEFTLSSFNIRDNFLKSYDYFKVANEMVLASEKPPKGKGITPFMSYPALSKTKYPQFLGQEGVFEERTVNGWRDAYGEWIEFGKGFGHPKAGPNRYDFIHRFEYTPEEFGALTDEQRYWSTHYGKIVNYNFWRKRCRMESDPALNMQAGREAFFKARAALRSGSFEVAKTEFEKGFEIWKQLLTGDQDFRDDLEVRDEAQENEALYLRMLNRLGLPVAEKFAPRPYEGIYPPLLLDAPSRQFDLAR